MQLQFHSQIVACLKFSPGENAAGSCLPCCENIPQQKIFSKRNYCYVRITEVLEQHPGEATGHGAAFKVIPT